MLIFKNKKKLVSIFSLKETIVKILKYVCQSVELKLNEPNWQTVFENPLFKSIVINMGSQSNISNTSSMSRIHKNLFFIAQKNNQKITALNCNFLTLTELRVEIKSVQDGFVLLKNAHLASKDVTDFIKSLCDMVNSELWFLFKYCFIFNF